MGSVGSEPTATAGSEIYLGAEWETAGRVRVVRPRWGGAILVCGKCLKRHENGKDLRQGIKAELKERAAAHPTRRNVRIIKIACIGLCPRRAVVLASPKIMSAGEVMLVRDARDLAVALPRLLDEAAIE